MSGRKSPLAANELLTAEQAAAYLKLPLDSLYRLVRQGAIPHLRPSPRRIRFRLEMLDEYMHKTAEAAIGRR